MGIGEQGLGLGRRGRGAGNGERGRLDTARAKAQPGTAGGAAKCSLEWGGLESRAPPPQECGPSPALTF